MKKSLILLSLVLGMWSTLSAQTGKNPDPDRAKYFIKGNLSITADGNRKLVYRLENPMHSKGINFEEMPAITGEVTDREDVQFEFRNAFTDYAGGFENNRLQFWRYDEELAEWQPDIETRQGTASFEQTKVLSLLLLIDCSTSLGADFDLVKENAKYFINLLTQASGKGNLKVGIIGFSTVKDTRIFDITSLSESTNVRMQTFIDGLELSNGTALYYSMDKAMGMLQQYMDVNHIRKEDYADSYIVTFTDGVDQTSQHTEKNLFTADDYYEYLKTQLSSVQILDRPVNTYIVGVKGRDIVTEKMAAKFDRVLSGISPEYKTIAQVSQLREEFQRIVSELTRQWSTLKCYVPKGFKGMVGWTFANATEESVSEKEVKTETSAVQKRPSMFSFPQDARIAAAAGLGMEFFAKTFSATVFSLDFNITVPLKQEPGYAVGAYIQPVFGKIPGLCLGAMMSGPLNSQTSFLAGAGLDFGFNITGQHADETCMLDDGTELSPNANSTLKGGTGFNVRGGLAWNKYYTFADLTLGSYRYQNEYQAPDNQIYTIERHPVKFRFGIHVGYVF